MLVVHDAWKSTDLPRHAVVTIGNYDGLHLGQRAVIQKVVDRAREQGRPAMVITFDPHPLAVISPDGAPTPLTLPQRKQKLLEDAGIDALAVIAFTPEFARTSAEDFVRELLAQRLAIEALYVGSEFGFGKGREGDLSFLQARGRELGFEAVGVPVEMFDGAPIHSTRIRQALRDGKADDAREMLGRPYSLTCTVVRGDRMGQKLGWPTINLDPEGDVLRPADGVYATRVFFPGFPSMFTSVTNIGTRPTVYENFRRVVESHILSFSSDVYGQSVEVFFYSRLREEKIFPTVMDLSAQIRKDVEDTREFFSRITLDDENHVREDETEDLR
jgi:riboflavin kinase/FMN adenylyltransferase